MIPLSHYTSIRAAWEDLMILGIFAVVVLVIIIIAAATRD